MTIFKSTLAGAVVLASLMSVAAVAPVTAAPKAKTVKTSLKITKARIGIGLKTNRVSRSALSRMIRQQALAQGVKLSRKEVGQAANAASSKLASAGNGPQKGIIHLKFRRFTICISWGADKGHC